MASSSSADFPPGAHRIDFQGEPAWFKRHGGSSRRLRLRVLDALMRILGLSALRPPPHPVGAEACATEARRLDELAALGVSVPRVLARGDDYLILSDEGSTLAGSLRQGTPEEAAALFSRAVAEIAGAHAKGAWLGQPQARNITMDAAGKLCFIDFEEDPGEVMGLPEAQARDWLVFLAGTVRHLPHGVEVLARQLAPSLARARPEVRRIMELTSSRLRFLGVLANFSGSRAAGLGKAVRVLRRALGHE